MIIRKNSDSTISVLSNTDVIAFGTDEVSFARIMSPHLVVDGATVRIGSCRSKTIDLYNGAEVHIDEIVSRQKVVLLGRNRDAGSRLFVGGVLVDPDSLPTFRSRVLHGDVRSRELQSGDRSLLSDDSEEECHDEELTGVTATRM